MKRLVPLLALPLLLAGPATARHEHHQHPAPAPSGQEPERVDSL